jgi:hypothetical protein
MSMTTRTDQQIYKTIADVVNGSAPADWQKIIVSASIADDNGETLYDYMDELGKQKWFIPETSKQYEVFMAFQELRSLMRASGHLWDTARFTLERSGKFRMEFNYEN